MADARAKAEAADDKEGNGGDRKGKGRAKLFKRTADAVRFTVDRQVDEGDICVMEAWSIDIVKTFFNKGVKAIAGWLTKLQFLQIDLLDASKKEIHNVAGFSGLTRDTQSYIRVIRNATLRANKVINFKQVAIDLKLPDVVKKAAAAVWDVNYGDEVGRLVMNWLRRNDQLAFKPGFNPNKVQIGLLSHNLDPP
ncbi:hypothetical protein Rhopal_000868-T1 [Rhodotorula paludigena]|uniref:Uncharacterized protein n=1 Tax=Rhodotorula paludigena TaxID=86838 RepID=A0AAV5GCU4_9BASI|nr:hypothetical protein Rhopal_000868-T1 [Rhodotorula paludigena]